MGSRHLNACEDLDQSDYHVMGAARNKYLIHINTTVIVGALNLVLHRMASLFYSCMGRLFMEPLDETTALVHVK